MHITYSSFYIEETGLLRAKWPTDPGLDRVAQTAWAHCLAHFSVQWMDVHMHTSNCITGTLLLMLLLWWQSWHLTASAVPLNAPASSAVAAFAESHLQLSPAHSLGLCRQQQPCTRRVELGAATKGWRWPKTTRAGRCPVVTCADHTPGSVNKEVSCTFVHWQSPMLKQAILLKFTFPI
jgi:hypothetical protein